jgi:DNA modification methylase
MPEQTCEWKEFPKNMNNPLHTICSYMAMFPPSVPHYFIDKYSNENDIILDPFSGRGTTVLEACLMNRIGIGNDKSPLAYVLTKAKSNVPQKGRILSRIKELESKFNPSKISIDNEPEQIKMIFSDSTLKQMIFLKNNLNWSVSNVDTFISAMLLGILHGQSEGYLSVSMPNTFSMAPNYVKNFIKEHNLKKPDRNAFALLNTKLERCYQKSNKRGKAYHQDVRKMSKIKDSSVDLIITSPPYTRVIRYGEYNWIRLWFFGKTGKEVDKNLFFSQSMNKYCDFISASLKEMKRVLSPNGKAVLVIGDVKYRTSDEILNLAEEVWQRCAKPLNFKLVEPIIADIISDNTKVSKIWGKKKGNATKIDRILILQKN